MAEDGMTSSNVDANGQSIVVGQIHAPPTPFNSDMNPLSDFVFTGREDAVTVKDVEEIVSAIKDSFSKFIETQRSYLDNEKKSNSVSESEKEPSKEQSDISKKEPEAEDVAENSGLTKADDSDIIQQISEKNSSSLDDIENVLNNLDSEFESRFSSIESNISEKLLDSSENTGQTEEDSSIYESKFDEYGEMLSLLDLLNSSSSKIENRVEQIYSKLESTEEENSSLNEESVNEEETDSIDVSENEVNEYNENDFNENEEFNDVVISRIDDLFTSNFDNLKIVDYNNEEDNSQESEFEEFKDNQVSFFDTIKEMYSSMSNLLIGFKENKTVSEPSIDYGFLKSMVESMIQYSSIEMIVSKSFNGINSSLIDGIKNNFKDLMEYFEKSDESVNSKTFSEDEYESVEGYVHGDNSSSYPEENLTTEKISLYNDKSIQEKISKENLVGNTESANTEKNDSDSSKDESKNSIFGFISDSVDFIKSLFSKKPDMTENEEVQSERQEYPIEGENDNETIVEEGGYGTEQPNGFEYEQFADYMKAELFSELNNGKMENADFENYGEYESKSMFDEIISNFKEMSEHVLSIDSKKFDFADDFSDSTRHYEEYVSDDYSPNHELISPKVEYSENAKDIERTDNYRVNSDFEYESSLEDGISEIVSAINSGVQRNDERFDRLEGIIAEIPKNINTVESPRVTNVIGNLENQFDVERIH